VQERITPKKLRELTGQAAINLVRRHPPGDTLSEETISELRRPILEAIPALR
jgi:hypothetical protein